MPEDLDPGLDAGPDAGPDIGLDEGLDAGLDAGTAADAVTSEVVGEVERFPGVGGWYVVRLGAGRSADVAGSARRGSVPVELTVGGTTWDSSLMPLGDGTLFLALPAAVRRAEDLDEGDTVRARYRLRPARTTPTASRTRRRGRS